MMAKQYYMLTQHHNNLNMSGDIPMSIGYLIKRTQCLLRQVELKKSTYKKLIKKTSLKKTKKVNSCGSKKYIENSLDPTKKFDSQDSNFINISVKFDKIRPKIARILQKLGKLIKQFYQYMLFHILLFSIHRISVSHI